MKISCVVLLAVVTMSLGSAFAGVKSATVLPPIDRAPASPIADPVAALQVGCSDRPDRDHCTNGCTQVQRFACCDKYNAGWWAWQCKWGTAAGGV